MIYVPDVSFYQYRYKTDGSVEKGIDFQHMATKVPGVIIRAGQNTWKDKMFDTSWAQAKTAGLKCGSYWFYDPRIEPKRQAETWAEVTRNDRGEMEFWADFERLVIGGKEAHGYDNPHQWYDFMEYCKQAMPGKQFGVYTGYYYWMERHLKEPMPYWNQYPLWIAAYGAKPLIPKPWTDYVYWQFTDNGNGPEYGVASGNIDLNYFNGKLTDFEARYGQSQKPPEENEKPMITYEMTVITSGTNRRVDTNLTATVVGKHNANAVLSGTEWRSIDAGNQWLFVTHENDIELAVPGWVAYRYNGSPICRDLRTPTNPAPAPVPVEDVEVTVSIKDGVTTVFVNGQEWHK